MSQNKSLSTQEVADMLFVSKSTIYNLIRSGELKSYKIGRKIRFTQDDVDAFISRSHFEQTSKPVSRVEVENTLFNPSQTENAEILISGQDAVLDILASSLRQNGVNASRCYLSGFEGLLSLYQGKVDVVACHLYDSHSGQYNIPFVKLLMPGVRSTVIHIARRSQGFYVKKGNPKSIRSWEDLSRNDVTIINRRAGSGSRILLDGKLLELGIPTSSVKGYDNIIPSHLTLASAIAGGEADVGIGTERVSKKVRDLDFIPLITESFDLVVRTEFLLTDNGQKMMELLRSTAFRNDVAGLAGNDYLNLGHVVAEV